MEVLARAAMGVALASCLPSALTPASAGRPLYLLLGGVCALLPDTLDELAGPTARPADIQVVPDPLRPDAGEVARAFALAAAETILRGGPVRVRVHPAPLSGREAWEGRVTFDVRGGNVRVAFRRGASTGPAGTERAERSARREGRARLPCALHLDHLAELVLDGADGLLVDYLPAGAGAVRVVPLPNRRTWSHSLLIAVAAGGVLWLTVDGVAALVAVLAMTAHAGLDHIGQMGVAWFFPFVRRRPAGLRLIARGYDRRWSATVIWLAAVAIMVNVARCAPSPDLRAAVLPLAQAGILVAVVAWVAARRWFPCR